MKYTWASLARVPHDKLHLGNPTWTREEGKRGREEGEGEGAQRGSRTEFLFEGVIK